MARRKCDWCPNTTKDAPAHEDPDGYYQAWDWYVCHDCFRELCEEKQPKADTKEVSDAKA